jgi:hypothetical protein
VSKNAKIKTALTVYLEDSETCPFCSASTAVGEMTGDGDSQVQAVQCTNEKCRASFYEKYTLQSVSLGSEPLWLKGVDEDDSSTVQTEVLVDESNHEQKDFRATLHKRLDEIGVPAVWFKEDRTQEIVPRLEWIGSIIREHRKFRDESDFKTRQPDQSSRSFQALIKRRELSQIKERLTLLVSKLMKQEVDFSQQSALNIVGRLEQLLAKDT